MRTNHLSAPVTALNPSLIQAPIRATLTWQGTNTLLNWTGGGPPYRVLADRILGALADSDKDAKAQAKVVDTTCPQTKDYENENFSKWSREQRSDPAFLDGNGRVGRLLITLQLRERDILPAPLLYLSAFFEATRTDYYAGLRAVSENGDWEGWVQYFLNGAARQSEDAFVLKTNASTSAPAPEEATSAEQ